MLTSTSAPASSSTEHFTFLLLHQALAAAVIDLSSSIYISLSTRRICPVIRKKLTFVNTIICDVTLFFDKQAVGA